MQNNRTMMQFFEWYLPEDCKLWESLKEKAELLSKIGITDIWLPPAYKAAEGKSGVGYSVYDLYDLGEFDQKGSVPTKYGSKDEYLEAIKALQENQIKVYADTVLNHKMGADETEEIFAVEDCPENREMQAEETPKMITAWTKYNFPGRNNMYSDFKWNWTHFHGVDWDEKLKKSSIYKFYGKHWDNEVDKENGNFDYLMGADVDLNNVDVYEELKRWGKWYLDFTKVDGFRLDAVKHIRSSFLLDFLKEIREEKKPNLYAVGEYWTTNISAIQNFITETKSSMHLFDVPLHYNFFNASNSNGQYDMRTIFDNTIVQIDPNLAVTFVDNHDTQPGQALYSFVQDWFKPLAYCLILLRPKGLPCVFYGDYYGIPHDELGEKRLWLNRLLYVRKNLAYGTLTDYFDDPNIVGWTYSGDSEHPNSGFAVIMSDAAGGQKMMNLGPEMANCVLYDATGNLPNETVYVDQDGNGIFYCGGGSVSVWVKKENREEIAKATES